MQLTGGGGKNEINRYDLTRRDLLVSSPLLVLRAGADRLPRVFSPHDSTRNRAGVLLERQIGSNRKQVQTICHKSFYSWPLCWIYQPSALFGAKPKK
jgi:hypothetical protein